MFFPEKKPRLWGRSPVPTSRRSRELFHVKLQCLHLQHPRSPKTLAFWRIFSKSGLKGGKNPLSLIRKMKQNQLKTQNTSKRLFIHPSNNLYWGPQIANFHHTSKNIPHRKKKSRFGQELSSFLLRKWLDFFSHPETGHLLPQKSRQNPKPDLGLLGYSTPRRYQCSGHLFGTQPVVFGRFVSHLFWGGKFCKTITLT